LYSIFYTFSLLTLRYSYLFAYLSGTFIGILDVRIALQTEIPSLIDRQQRLTRKSSRSASAARISKPGHISRVSLDVVEPAPFFTNVIAFGDDKAQQDVVDTSACY
jgi:hypothetical protein